MLDYKESWTWKNWCFWIDASEQWCWRRLLDRKEIQLVNAKGNQSWAFIERTDAEAETPVLWAPGVKNWLMKRPWCWESLKAGGEGDDKRWDGWMASPIQWTWVWASSRSWWWTGKPGELQSMGSQRVRHNWVTQLNWSLKRSKISIWCRAMLSHFRCVWLQPMDCGQPGSSVHESFQARILETVAVPCSRGSSRPRNWHHISGVSCLAGRFFTHLASWEA